MATTTCFLQIAPTWAGWDSSRLSGISAQRVTGKKPRQPIPGAVTVKLTIRIPDAAFLPLAPAATIEIPIEHASVTVSSVTPVEIVE